MLRRSVTVPGFQRVAVGSRSRAPIAPHFFRHRARARTWRREILNFLASAGLAHDRQRAKKHNNLTQKKSGTFVAKHHHARWW
jgi:hypothetical protein